MSNKDDVFYKVPKYELASINATAPVIDFGSFDELMIRGGLEPGRGAQRKPFRDKAAGMVCLRINMAVYALTRAEFDRLVEQARLEVPVRYVWASGWPHGNYPNAQIYQWVFDVHLNKLVVACRLVPPTSKTKHELVKVTDEEWRDLEDSLKQGNEEVFEDPEAYAAHAAHELPDWSKPYVVRDEDEEED